MKKRSVEFAKKAIMIELKTRRSVELPEMLQLYPELDRDSLHRAGVQLREEGQAMVHYLLPPINEAYEVLGERL